MRKLARLIIQIMESRKPGKPQKTSDSTIVPRMITKVYYNASNWASSSNTNPRSNVNVYDFLQNRSLPLLISIIH